MPNPDVVDHGDAALQELLASVAEYVSDPLKREMLLDFRSTMRPLAEWSTDELDMLTQMSSYIIGLGHISRELERFEGPDDCSGPLGTA